MPGKDGTPDRLVPLGKPVLKKGAVPSMFLGLPSYLSSEAPTAKTDPETRRRNAEQVLDAANEEWLKSSKVSSLADVEKGLPKNHSRTIWMSGEKVRL